MLITDAQIHIWTADSPDRPWGAILGTRGAIPHREKPFEAPELVEEMDRAGVQRAVLIPPGFEGERADLCLQAAQDYPGRFAVMGRIELDAESAPDRLRTWRDTPGMLGVRLTFTRLTALGYERVDDAGLDWFFAACAEHDVPVMLYLPGQNDAIGEVARRHPEVRLIIDHANLHPKVRDEAIQPEIDALLGLEGEANVAVKLSALPLYVSEGYPFPSLRPIIHRVIATLGAPRCMWGSDIPRLPCTYGQWVQAMLEHLDDLSEDDRALVMGGTLAAWLRWPTGAAG